MAKAELNQIGSPTLDKDLCNKSSVFLQLYFCISAISFAFLQHIPSTLRLNRTHLVQQTLCDENGAPTDFLWWKKRDVTNTGHQPTSLSAKKVMWQTWAPTDLWDVQIKYFHFLIRVGLASKPMFLSKGQASQFC